MNPTEIICPHCHKSFDLKTDLKSTVWLRLQASIVDNQVSRARNEMLAEVLEQKRLKDAEKDALIDGLRMSIESLQRKATQASQQLQGDAMEVDVVDALRQAFPSDNITRTGKGKNGADILHAVRDPHSGECGLILTEVKNTSNWSDSWIVKLRRDALRSKAALAVLVTRTLPNEVESFGLVDGIWVTNRGLHVPLALALRAQLVACATLRRQMPYLHRDTVVSFVTGPQFTQRVRAIVSLIVEMRAQVDREKQAMTKHWTAREQMIGDLADNVTGFRAELETVTNRRLLVELPSLSDRTAEVDTVSHV